MEISAILKTYTLHLTLYAKEMKKRKEDRYLTNRVFMELSGPGNKDWRQKIVWIYTGEKRPKAKCGVTVICDFLLGLTDEEIDTVIEKIRNI